MSNTIMSMLQELVYAIISVGVGFVIAFLKKQIGVTNMQQLTHQSALIKQVVDAGVKYVEQTYSTGDKLNGAVTWIVGTLSSKGISVTEEEIKGLIEASVRDLKDQFGEDWGKAIKTDTTETTTTETTTTETTVDTTTPVTPVVDNNVQPVVTENTENQTSDSSKENSNLTTNI